MSIFRTRKESPTVTLKLQEELRLIDKHMRELEEFREFFQNVDTKSNHYNEEVVRKQFVKVLRRQVKEVQEASL